MVRVKQKESCGVRVSDASTQKDIETHCETSPSCAWGVISISNSGDGDDGPIGRNKGVRSLIEVAV